MRKNLTLGFIILLFLWNAYVFISFIPDNSLRRSMGKEVFKDNNKFTEINITEAILPESDWKPIENSLDYNFSEKESKGVKNGTSVIEYDIINKIETVTSRRDVEVLGFNTTNLISERIEGNSQRLTAEINGPQPATIFPPDDRQKITNTDEYPWGSICKLYITAADDSVWVGSGAIIDEIHVLTAGHNVYLHDNGGWASSVEVIPGKDGSYEPFGSAMVTNMRSYTGWTEDEMAEHDWAVLTIDTNMGDYTGWLGIQTAGPSHSIYTGTLHTAGYPGDLDNGINMYYTTGSGDYADEFNHRYWLDSAAGQSGSPVWTDDGSDRYIVSVHAYSYGNESYSNFGTRINQDKFDQISIWLNEDSYNPLPDLRDRGDEYWGFSPYQISIESSAIDIYNYIENVGFVSVGAFEVFFYLSTDTTVTTSDYLLGIDVITSLDVDSNAESRFSGLVPPSTPDGNYYVGWIIDPSNSIEELNENNNAYVFESELVSVDMTEPISSIFYTPISGTNRIDRNTVFSINSYDIFGSGVNITYYQIDNGSRREYKQNFTLAQFDMGIHTIYYSSVDNFQNIEEVNIEVVVKIDLSDSELALRIGLVIGVGVLEFPVYLFIVKRYFRFRNLTKKFTKKKGISRFEIYDKLKKRFKKSIKKRKRKKKVNIYDLR